MNVSRPVNPNAIFRCRTYSRIVDSESLTAGISAPIRHQIRCAVCRCFRTDADRFSQDAEPSRDIASQAEVHEKQSFTLLLANSLD